MKDKIIKTTCPFPLLMYQVTVKYNEVRKASGIAYILLDLIQKSETREEKIANELLRFGIPADLHIIFGQELARLEKEDIIKCSLNINYILLQKYFSEVKLADLTLTERGEKLFKDGAIPTGQERVAISDIFYSPVTRKFSLSSALPHYPLASSFLGENFLDKVDIDVSGMEDFIHANQTRLGLKPEERIFKIEYSEPQRLVVRKEDGASINLSAASATFTFGTTDEQAFFEKHYSAMLMTECMSAKDRYKFTGQDGNVLEMPKINSSELAACDEIYIPDDFKKQAAAPCKVYLGRGEENYVRTDNVLQPDSATAKRLLYKIHPNSEFALLGDHACYYCCWTACFPSPQFGDDFQLPLLAKYTLEQQAFYNILDELFEYYLQQPLGDEVSKFVLYVVGVTGKNDYFKKCIDRYSLSAKTVDEKIDGLLKAHQLFASNKNWKGNFISVAKALFNQSAAEIRIDNMIYKNAILTPVKSALEMTDAEYVKKFADAVHGEDESLIWQALEAVGFSTDSILSVVNIVPRYLETILNNEDIEEETDFAVPFKTVRFNLWKLNAMLGIENSESYTIGEQYNTDEFFNIYGTIVSAYQKISKYKSYASKQFDKLERYFNIYRPIHELLAIERTSASHPEKINKKYVDDLLARGKYKDAVCDLLVKLQYDLRKLLSLDNAAAANELINEAMRRNLISQKQADSLHKLRICRNNFQHPESNQVQYNKELIEKWRDDVFLVAEENK